MIKEVAQTHFALKHDVLHYKTCVCAREDKIWGREECQVFSFKGIGDYYTDIHVGMQDGRRA